MPQQIHFRSSHEPEIKVNGTRLAGVLEKIISERVSSASERKELISRLAIAAGVEPSKIQELLAGELTFPEPGWIATFAAVLGVPQWIFSVTSDADVSDLMRSLEPAPGGDTVAMLCASAARMVQNCTCEKPEADDPDTVLQRVIVAAAAVVRG
jgi:hypothetical protein